MNDFLKENERIDDLEFKNLKIIQNKNGFCFGIDSVLLVNFAKEIKKQSKVLDLGTGTGIIPILLSGKVELKKSYWGRNTKKDVANMAKRSVSLNNLDDKIEIINENVINIGKLYPKQYFDVVITNPPYKKMGTGIINESEAKIISRHEITANLEDFIKTARDMLKDKGEFFHGT